MVLLTFSEIMFVSRECVHIYLVATLMLLYVLVVHHSTLILSTRTFHHLSVVVDIELISI